MAKAAAADATERRRGMDEFSGELAGIKEQIASLHADLRVFLTQYETEYKALCSRQKTIGDEVSVIDESIRGNGKPGLNERISKLEQQMKTQTAVTAFIGTSVGGYIIYAVLSHFLP